MKENKRRTRCGSARQAQSVVGTRDLCLRPSLEMDFKDVCRQLPYPSTLGYLKAGDDTGTSRQDAHKR